MKFIDLTIPLGIGTPPWPTYEPLQVKYFKRLAPNGANGQVVTHSNHIGTHLDGEIHFYTPGKDIASLDFDFLAGNAAIVDLSDICGDYDVYTPEMIEERVEVREGDILIIHTGYHHFGWDQPYGNEVRYMVMHPGPDARFAEWCIEKKIKWIGVDCGSADHPMNTKIRDWMPAQAEDADAYFREKYGKSLAEYFTKDMYQMMHLWMFDKGIIHAECVGGDIDLLVNRRVQVGCFPWRFVDGEASIARIVAMVDDDEYDELMKKKAAMPKTKFGDCYDPVHVERLGGRLRLLLRENGLVNTDLEKLQGELLIAFTNFFQVASQMEPNKLYRPGVCGDWSPKEVLSHLIGWDQSVQAFIADPDNFDPPYDVDVFNAQSVSERQSQTWKETIVELQTSFQGLEKAVTAVTPEIKIYSRVLSWLTGRKEDYEFHTSQFEMWVV